MYQVGLLVLYKSGYVMVADDLFNMTVIMIHFKSHITNIYAQLACISGVNNPCLFIRL